MTAGARRVALTATCVTVALVGITGLVGAVTALTDPAGIRESLHFGFAHVPQTPSQVLSIFLNNLPLLCVPLLMAVDVQLRTLIDGVHTRRAYVVCCDFVAAAPLGHSVLAVGVAVGVYGTRMLAAMLPSGPVEIAAFAIASSVYVNARGLESAKSLRALIWPASAAVGLLALAAALEALT